MGEIQYDTPEGMVHSDIPDDDRAFLHAALDEWLDKANGTGGFYIGDCLYFPQHVDDIRDIVHEYDRRNNSYTDIG